MSTKKLYLKEILTTNYYLSLFKIQSCNIQNIDSCLKYLFVVLSKMKSTYSYLSDLKLAFVNKLLYQSKCNL